MPQQPLSFGDGIQKIVGTLAQMELDPAADDNLISEVRSVLLSFVRSATQSADPMGGMSPDMGPAAVPGTLDLASMGAMPVEEAGLSRGPTPSPDIGGMTEELRRVMNGA